MNAENLLKYLKNLSLDDIIESGEDVDGHDVYVIKIKDGFSTLIINNQEGYE
jgi:hypothetical protein